MPRNNQNAPAIGVSTSKGKEVSTIPENIRELVMKQSGQVLRQDKESAVFELARLGIVPGSEIYEFFVEFAITLFISTSSDESLMDVAEPNPEILVGTEFVHEVWGIPEQYICLTSCEAEGCYLLSKETQSVYDFSLSERDAFISKPVPSWKSFFEFIEWYLSPGVRHEC